MTARAWYIVAAGLIISALTLGLVSYARFTDNLDGMQRVVMPGKADVTLPMGMTTLYAETRATVGGKYYEVGGDLSFTCALTSASGQPLVLQQTPGNVTYSLGGYAGRSAFDAMVPMAGTYKLSCESERTFVMAIGRGLGAWIVIMVVGLLPLLGGLFIVVFVWLRRRRQLRAARAA